MAFTKNRSVAIVYPFGYNDIQILTAKLGTLVADLESKEDIIQLADTFYTRYDTLDVLINNAGQS